MAKKTQEVKKTKSFEEHLFIILDKLAKREVGVDVDIAQFKEEYAPEPTSEPTSDAEPSAVTTPT